MRIYETLISHEKRRVFFHHFADEIKARLRQVYLYFLTHPQRLEDIPADLERVCALNLPKRETAWIYKKLAEFYFDINRHIQAERMLNTAFELYPRLTGAKRICQKLGVEYLPSQRV
jgi:tetratricopeptide (TPR) repeat protein